jgi:hypothetical protein
MACSGIFQVIYLAETDFGRIDIYRSLALASVVQQKPFSGNKYRGKKLNACICEKTGYNLNTNVRLSAGRDSKGR